jgi:hypothetical protein
LGDWGDEIGGVHGEPLVGELSVCLGMKNVLCLRTSLENVACDVTLSCDAAEWMIEETLTRRRRGSESAAVVQNGIQYLRCGVCRAVDRAGKYDLSRMMREH